MKNILKCVLLIDDDSTSSFITEIILKQVGCAERIVVVQNGKEALTYLESNEEKTHPKPELILLDANMPIMNGWEFIDEYRKINTWLTKPVIVMVSSSRNEMDLSRVNDIDEVSALIEKPFDHNNIESILKVHFPETEFA